LLKFINTASLAEFFDLLLEYLSTASFSLDGKRVVTASADSNARVWDAQSGAAIALLSGHTDDVYSASFSPYGKRAVTASADNTPRVWDLSHLVARIGR